MKKILYFGCKDKADFIEKVNTDFEFLSISSTGKLFEFHLEPGGVGYELYDYENEKDYEYNSLEEMLSNHIMPDGVRMIDVWNGENYRFSENDSGE